jgi:biotin---protein ligase
LISLTLGCGLNSMNPHPTTCLLNIIPQNLETPSQEQLLAHILSRFSDMYTEFLESGFRSFQQRYYQLWLHTDQIVAIDGGVARGRINGINIQEGGGGGLLVDEVDAEGGSLGRKVIEVTVDGNSFDMLKGLIRTKIAV